MMFLKADAVEADKDGGEGMAEVPWVVLLGG